MASCSARRVAHRVTRMNTATDRRAGGDGVPRVTSPRAWRPGGAGDPIEMYVLARRNRYNIALREARRN
jgi:hypothetical protein